MGSVGGLIVLFCYFGGLGLLVGAVVGMFVRRGVGLLAMSAVVLAIASVWTMRHFQHCRQTEARCGENWRLFSLIWPLNAVVFTLSVAGVWFGLRLRRRASEVG